MIRVNLLPRDVGAKRGGQVRGGSGSKEAAGGAGLSFLIFLVGLVLVGGSGYGAWWSYSEVVAHEEKRDAMKTKVTAMRKDAEEKGKEYNELKAKYDKAINKVRVLLMLDPPNRLLWTEKLNMIADIRPDGIAVTEMTLTEKVEMVETPESVKRQADYKKASAKDREKMVKPSPEKVPVISQIFTVKGIAYNLVLSKRYEDVNQFRKLLESHYVKMPDNSIRRFMDGFEENIVYGNFIDYEDYDGSGRRVTEFVFTLPTRPIQIEEGDVVIKRMKDELARRQRMAGLTPNDRIGQVTGADATGGM